MNIISRKVLTLLLLWCFFVPIEGFGETRKNCLSAAFSMGREALAAVYLKTLQTRLKFRFRSIARDREAFNAVEKLTKNHSFVDRVHIYKMISNGAILPSFVLEALTLQQKSGKKYNLAHAMNSWTKHRSLYPQHVPPRAREFYTKVKNASVDQYSVEQERFSELSHLWGRIKKNDTGHIFKQSEDSAMVLTDVNESSVFVFNIDTGRYTTFIGDEWDQQGFFSDIAELGRGRKKAVFIGNWFHSGHVVSKINQYLNIPAIGFFLDDSPRRSVRIAYSGADQELRFFLTEKSESVDKKYRYFYHYVASLNPIQEIE